MLLPQLSRLATVLALVAALLSRAYANPDSNARMAAAPPTHGADGSAPWTPRGIISQERLSGWQLSDDGTRVIYTRRTVDWKKDRFRSQLHAIDLDLPGGAKPVRLTTGAADVSSPTFVPLSGRALIFRSSRPIPDGFPKPPEGRKGPQLWKLDLVAGGEAQPISAVDFGVGPFQVIDENTVYFVTRDRRSYEELERKKEKDDVIVVEDPDVFADGARRLMRLDLKRGRVTRVTDNRDRMSGFWISPDGRRAVTRHEIDPSHEAEGHAPPRWFLRDLETGAASELFADRKSKPNTAVWSLDSSGFYLTYPESTTDGEDWGAVTRVAWVDADAPAPRPIDLDWERGLGWRLLATPEGFLALLADGTRVRLARFTRGPDGAFTRRFVQGPHADRLFSLSKARFADTVIFTTSGASEPDRVYAARLAGDTLVDAREIAHPNDGFARHAIARTEVMHWTGALGEEVEGIVYYPHDWREGERRPLVLMTHGGPHGVDQDRFREGTSSPNSYAQRGAFVLKTNYHGSSGYGLAFGESIRGRYYELELQDMFAGIQKLIDDGLVDRECMGLVGWSNGAILSIAALTLGHLYAPEYDFQFRACAPGAGDVNWTSDYGNCAFGAAFDDFYLGGPPWQLPELYVRKSPLFHAERVTTPTIIFFGTEDTNVPTEQGWQWYRALHRIGKAPVRFLLFPGQPHGLRKPNYQLRKLEEELAWFDRYLFETADLARDVVRERSPLDDALRAAAVARTPDGLAGVVEKGVLVPETVPLAPAAPDTAGDDTAGDDDDGERNSGDDAELEPPAGAPEGVAEIGRFEVTVAQWRQFDPRCEQGVPEALRGHPNHPATGITAEAAAGYVEWLCARTGATWRLPTAAEQKRIARKAGRDENTLDHWAGYAPSLRDQRALRALLEKLDLVDLLRAAGDSPPGRLGSDSEAILIYDTAGNAAELVTLEDGSVAPRGECALSSPDPLRPLGDVDLPREVVGLRVVRVRPPGPRSEAF